MDKLIGTLKGIGSLQGKLSGESSVSGSLSTPERIETPSFTGDYNYTPTAEQQVIEINGLRATSNITIEPIPSNYGLITWDGSILTVS